MHICHVSTFSPTPCGIATYTESLVNSLAGLTHSKVRLVYHCDLTASDIVSEIKIEDREGYSAAASAINRSEIDVVSLQHEFAIFGGRNGEYIIDFVSELRKPIVTTFHTTPTLLNKEQIRILQAVADRSAAVVVLTEKARENVARISTVREKVIVIRHGVPDVGFRAPAKTALRQEWDKEHVFFSAGHVSDRKGYTNTLAAMAELRSLTEDFLYIIVGTYQPQFGANSQCVYSLKRMIAEYDLSDHVRFIEDYVSLDLLIEYIVASDVGIVAYTDCQQSSSGMVPMILGCGRPVIATPFEYVKDMSKLAPGLYISEAYQSNHILAILRSVIDHKDSITASMPNIYASTRAWVWAKAAAAYVDLFEDACKRHKWGGGVSLARNPL